MALSICGGLIGCTSSQSNVVSMGNNTYTVTREATTTFNRNVEELKAQAQEDAAKFCVAHSKQLKVLDVTVNKPVVTTGYISAKVVFKAIDAAEVAAEAAAAAAPAPTEARAIQSTGDLYTELSKLDDLRKRGILTDEEFQSEKKKILNRSR